MTKLLPCPFCGEPPDHVVLLGVGDIACLGHTSGLCIEEWNRRSSLDETKALEEAARVCDAEAKKYSQRGFESEACRGALAYAAQAIRAQSGVVPEGLVEVCTNEDGVLLWCEPYQFSRLSASGETIIRDRQHLTVGSSILKGNIVRTIIKNTALSHPPAGVVAVPREPTLAHLESMALRHRHDFGLLDERAKESIVGHMRQLYEEATGQGFFKLAAAPQGTGEDK